MLYIIARVVKNELSSFRESLMYVELSTFVGCVLAGLREKQIISLEEEKKLRRLILDD